MPRTACPAAISCRATSRPTVPVASVTRMCTWAPFPNVHHDNRQIGLTCASVTAATRPGLHGQSRWLLQRGVAVRCDGDLRATDVFSHGRFGRGGIADDRQGARPVGRPDGHERLLRLPLAVEWCRPCFDGADALPLDQAVPGGLPVHHQLRVFPTEFGGWLGAV